MPSPTSTAGARSNQRKLRKGTFSCQECKRRKIRCILDPNRDSRICIACWNRGTRCVSQTLLSPDGVATYYGLARSSRGSTVSDRYSPQPRDDHGLPTPTSLSTEPTHAFAFDEASNGKNHTRGKYEKLSRFLHSSLPSREETEAICTASRHPALLSHEIMIMPYMALEKDGIQRTTTLLEIPREDTHPVLLAKHMLLLASLLQLLRIEQIDHTSEVEGHSPPSYTIMIKGLSEPPRVIMERLVNLSVKLVTTNDELLGSLEGLECIMIETLYQSNLGNLRRAWMSCRRAMNIAQLMGLDRPGNQGQYKVLAPGTRYNTDHMWFRMVFMDRYLSLMLGTSQGCLDRNIASDEMLSGDTPMGRLERIHCEIASQVLERNNSPAGCDDTSLTRDLDLQLQKAARMLPHQWWLVPELVTTTSPDSQDIFWNTRRIFVQVMHYNLLNQVHLPYLLRSTGDRYQFAQISCVKASQEILQRFIALRGLNKVACSCRTVDFLALMAAMTLILAHLDSRNSDQNLLAHSYHTDRALIEQVQNNMQEVDRLNSDALSAQSSELLGRLLAIDSEPTDSGHIRRVSIHKNMSSMDATDSDDISVIHIQIPYFGIIKITHDGTLRDGTLRDKLDSSMATATSDNPPAQSHLLNRMSTTTPESLHSEVHIPSSAVGGSHGTINIESAVPQSNVAYASLDPLRATPMLDTVQDGFPNSILQNTEYPELAASMEDWVLQGVDMAFFNSLMRSIGNGVGHENHMVYDH
ncbi:C6 zinc finger domain-containing protein [Penicillium herquei]|nr:C6 zinc finger domain-containing protein [Penicillium herquei]